MKIVIFGYLFIGILCGHKIRADEGIRPSQLLLNAFSNQCPQVVTRNVSATLVSLQSLHNIIEELKKDTNCGGSVAFSAAISRYTSLLENFETESSAKKDKRTLEKKIALYTGLLADPNLPLEQSSFLRTEILGSQASLVSINSNLARFETLSGKESQIADQLVRSADDFLTELQTVQGNACYQKNAAKISSIMSNTLLVTAAFASAGTSLAMAGGAVITKSIGKYINDYKFNNSLNIIQDIEMPTALRCVSQALTDQFCSTDEVRELISERINSNNAKSKGYDGINLLAYQLNSLEKWLEEVFSGSSITSEGDLINREKPEIQSEFLRKAASHLDAFGTIKRKFFLTLNNEVNLKTSISQNISCLVMLLNFPNLNPCSGITAESSVENPIFATYSRSLMSYELFEPGVHRTIPKCGQDDCTSLTNYVNFYKIPVTINDWDRAIKNALEIVQSTQNLVNIERSKMISVDAFSIIVNARRAQKGETSPLMGFNKIISNADRILGYLTSLDDKNGKYAPEIKNVQKIKELTISLINLINEGGLPRSIPPETLPMECMKDRPLSTFLEENDILEMKSFQITSCISKLLKLQERGTVVYFNKIRDMVGYEIEARLLNNDLGDEVLDIINSTKLDLIQSILNSYSSKESSISLGELSISLESAQNNSKETLNAFFDIFKKNILDSLNSSKLTRTEKNDLCIRTLPYLFSSENKLIKEIYPLCEKAQFNIYKNGPTISFTDFVKVNTKNNFKKDKYVLSSPEDMTKYFCSYRKYNRANLLIDEQNRQRSKEIRSK